MALEVPRLQVAHAVIIAAGSGGRFGEAAKKTPKPLMKVAGMPLIARTILTAQKAGIQHFTVVTGYRAAELEGFLREGIFRQFHIEFVRNNDWKRANGISVLKARGSLEEPFLLLMADHLFDAEIVRKLSERPIRPGRCRLAVDSKPGDHIDLDEATKVQVVDGYIRRIGKGLDDCNAVDTGIFLCTNSLFDALEKAISRGEESLSDGIRELAISDRMEAADIGGLFWQDVDNESDLRVGEKLLLQSLVSEKDSWLARRVNRRISLAATRHVARTGIKPNVVTFFHLSIGLGGSGLMLLATHLGFVMGSFLFLTSSILDGCDGEIARLKFMQSRFGAWLDFVGDNIIHLALFTCMTLGLMHFSGSALYLLPGGLLVFGSLASFIMSMVARKRMRVNRQIVFSQNRLQDALQTIQGRRIAKWVDLFANRDFAYLMFFLACFNRTGWFLWIAGIGVIFFSALFFTALVNGAWEEKRRPAVGKNARGADP